MNLSENQSIVNALKQILEYYDYLEYDENHSAGTNQLCLKVSDSDANCHLGVIKNICAQLGSEYTCEPERPTRFHIRIMDHRDYANMPISPYQDEAPSEKCVDPEPEPDSAIAYYYRGQMKCLLNQYEAGIADYKKAHSLNPNIVVPNVNSIQFASIQFNLMVTEQKIRSDRERFYWEHHSKFLEREANRAEVRKRHGTPEWLEKQAEVLKRDGMLCVCGDSATEVHHKTYENLGQEPLSDLVALCRYCYRGIHSGEKIKLWQGSNPMTNKEYREKYLESRNWKEKRERVLDRDRNLCICGERATYVHHKTYKNLGAEPLSDLIALCRNCHDGYHRRLPAKSESFWHMRA
ncbi:MAG: hypothetical protein OXH00_05190 [Candidatus Poribacteria bacterium]|nr:hypothetical protein [Candidatus Poribacteria bacterium]